MPEEALDEIWTPDAPRAPRAHVLALPDAAHARARSASTTPSDERYVVLLTRPFVLLTFQAPEYEMDDRPRRSCAGASSSGVLVAPAGRGGDGYLEIDVQRRAVRRRRARRSLHVEVEVANFYPAIASRARAAGSTRTRSRAST